jgi:hypothetical protein
MSHASLLRALLEELGGTADEVAAALKAGASGASATPPASCTPSFATCKAGCRSPARWT